LGIEQIGESRGGHPSKLPCKRATSDPVGVGIGATDTTGRTVATGATGG